MPHPAPRRLFAGIALLILGLTTLLVGVFLVDWYRHAGTENDIAARGPFIAMVMLPWMGGIAGLATAAFASGVAWRRRQFVPQVLVGVVAALVVLAVLLVVTVGFPLVAPGLLGPWGYVAAGAAESLVGGRLILRRQDAAV